MLQGSYLKGPFSLCRDRAKYWRDYGGIIGGIGYCLCRDNTDIIRARDDFPAQRSLIMRYTFEPDKMTWMNRASIHHPRYCKSPVAANLYHTFIYSGVRGKGFNKRCNSEISQEKVSMKVAPYVSN